MLALATRDGPAIPVSVVTDDRVFSLNEE